MNWHDVMHRFVALIIAIVGFGWSSQAVAQVFADEDASGGDGTQTFYFSSTTTTTTAVGVAMIFASVVSITPEDDSAAIERYLRENAVALEGDVHLGAGQTIDDLAFLLGVPLEERPRFGRALRAAREDLLELAAPEQLTSARVTEFVRIARTTWAVVRRLEASAT